MFFWSIQGIEKHKLLKKVLEHLKTIPKWQRIYMEYSEQLNEPVENTTATDGPSENGKDTETKMDVN